MAKHGRPTTYTKALAAKICERLAAGEYLRAICRDDDMPKESTVRAWALKDWKENKDDPDEEGFYAQYARGRDLGLDAMGEETLEIADTPLLGVKTTKKANGDIETVTGDMIERARLRVDTRKWYLAKLAPKRYGEKITQEHTGAEGEPLIPKLTDMEAARRIAFILQRGDNELKKQKEAENESPDT